MKKTKILMLVTLLLIALMLPAMLSCAKTDPVVVTDETPANLADGGSGSNADSPKSDDLDIVPEAPATPEPTQAPGADVAPGGVLKAYNFADGTFQGIETGDKYFDSAWDLGDPAEIKDMGGKNWLKIGSKFTGGWELVLYRLPEADMPLISKASVLKYDLLIPTEDIDKAPYVEITPALKTDWGEDWDTKVIHTKKEFFDAAAIFNDDYYLYTVNIPYALHGELIVDNGGVFEAYVGIVFNGVKNLSDNPVYIGNIEFIK